MLMVPRAWLVELVMMDAPVHQKMLRCIAMWFRISRRAIIVDSLDGSQFNSLWKNCSVYQLLLYVIGYH